MIIDKLLFRRNRRCSLLQLLLFYVLFYSTSGGVSSLVGSRQRSSVLGRLGNSNSASCNKSTDFYCAFSARCIPQNWLCDGDDDCLDGADETNCENKTCPPSYFKCTNQRCIPAAWICDTEDDCGDNTDEQHRCTVLPVNTCPVGEFFCNESNLCINASLKCNSMWNCPRGEDERFCPTRTPAVTCKNNEYACKNGHKCVPKIWLCDEDDDCGDGSDETATICNVTCKESEFACGAANFQGHHCIPKRWVCDTDPDCLDGSDELHCDRNGNSLLNNVCTKRDEFRCANGYCIHKNWLCDGDYDCPDKSDEVNCTACDPATQFTCAETKHCIDKKKRCDGILDCMDDSDEDNCPTKAPKKCNAATEFDCGFGGICIKKSQVCDGVNDCPKNSDEANCTVQDECAKRTNLCGPLQVCRDTKDGARCICKPGYSQNASDRKQCDDIDECQSQNKTLCSHGCKNTVGSYQCRCHHGYTLAPDRHKCLAVGEQPKLWVTSKNHVREIDLRTNSGRPKLQHLTFAVAMDFHFEKKIIAWSDIENQTIFTCQLDPKMEEPVDAVSCLKPLVSRNITAPDGLAIDWIHDLLYWTDADENWISVVRLNGSHRRTLIRDDLEKPRAIALDPSKGLMFWTDWGTKQPKLERASMDGTNRKVLTNDTNEVLWPNGLTLDLVKEHVYWADGKLRHIMRCDYDGANKMIVVSSSRDLRHPFSLTFFEDQLYWTDWSTQGVHYASKFDGGKTNVMAQYVHGSTTLKVHHNMAQPPALNKCLHQNCDHLCVPVFSKMGTQYSCLCADDYISSEGGPCRNNNDAQSLEQNNGESVVVTGSNMAVVGLVLSLIVAISSFICCVGWVMWKRHRKTEHLRWTFGNLVYRNGAESTNVSGLDNNTYDHLRMTFDDSSNFNDVYQPTTTTAGVNYVLNGGRSNINSKDTMKMPLTEHMYDDC